MPARAYARLSLAVSHEEPALRATFGDSYVWYCETVPRLLPRPRRPDGRLLDTGRPDVSLFPATSSRHTETIGVPALRRYMTATATLAGGCFWCIEAAFDRVRGVEQTVSGYCGGHVEDPSYRAVCNGTTGHAEAVQITYDPDAVSYQELLEVFFEIHNPTTENREGPDVGSQYRSAVFYHDDQQRDVAESYIDELEQGGEYGGVVTEVAPLETFYRAEETHQNYFEKHPNKPYCRMQIPPKLEKIEEKHRDKLAESAQ